ncbi:MAG: hypothetical protein JW971_00650, partial [Synergistales bacterium]|nr:hypothetical protein [Synergistales bacterium]
PVRGWVSQNFAIGRNFVFLNASGQIANLGNYAWDRKNGNIYRVFDREDNPLNFWFLYRR